MYASTNKELQQKLTDLEAEYIRVSQAHGETALALDHGKVLLFSFFHTISPLPPLFRDRISNQGLLIISIILL